MNKLWNNIRQEKLQVKLAGFYLFFVLFLAAAAPFLPLEFTPNELHLEAVLLPPAFLDEGAFLAGHWLGTDNLGRDVLANLVYGFRTGFLVAIPVILIAFTVGIFLGSMAAYFGNRSVKVSRAAALVAPVCFFAVFFYGFYIRQFNFATVGLKANIFLSAVLVALMLVAVGLVKIMAWFLKKIPALRRPLFVPIDELVLKATEVLTSVPRLVLVLSLAAISAPGIGNILLLLSLTYWSGPARLVRGEVLRIKVLPFTEAARMSGVPDFRILFRHVLPNAAGPLITAFAFGVGSLLALEATLSFLGIGLPPETPSWGRMLAEARLNPDAWWLIFFPVLSLCLTILAVQVIGNSIRKRFL